MAGVHAYQKTWFALISVSNFLAGTIGKLWYKTIHTNPSLFRKPKVKISDLLFQNMTSLKNHPFSSQCKGLWWPSQTESVFLAPNSRPKWKSGLTSFSYLSLTACQLLTKKSFATYRPTSNAATTSIIFVSLKLNEYVVMAYSIYL